MKLYKDLKHPIVAKRRYFEDNTTYGEIDALTLYGMILQCKPKRIIEIGSGFSSAVMLDVNQYCFDNQIKLQFIEPFPNRLKNLLKEQDNISLYDTFLQEVDKTIFDELESGDILFVDSSHMSKMGSDVNEIIFSILPRLKAGVYIHFHDIFIDFEYPQSWIKKGWIWNETYLLRAFLMNNYNYQIVFFCDQWNEQFRDTGMFENFVGGANIWIRKQ